MSPASIISCCMTCINWCFILTSLIWIFVNISIKKRKKFISNKPSWFISYFSGIAQILIQISILLQLYLSIFGSQYDQCFIPIVVIQFYVCYNIICGDCFDGFGENVICWDCATLQYFWQKVKINDMKTENIGHF